MSNELILASRRLGVALCVLTVAVVVGACGSSTSSSSSSAAAGTGATSVSTGSTTARLNLAKCLRANGIDVSDSGTTSGAGAGGGAGGIFAALRNYPRAQVEAAEKACKQYLAAAFPQTTLTAAQRAARTQELVKYATCMRSHGVDIPDPTTSGGGSFAFGAGSAGSSNFRALLNTPAYKTANAACASLRPKFGGGTAAAGAAGA
jgi:GH24 family phage-related lysozyme (muramidase)